MPEVSAVLTFSVNEIRTAILEAAAAIALQPVSDATVELTGSGDELQAQVVFRMQGSQPLARRSKHSELIVAHLTKHPSGLSPVEIAQGTGLDYSAVAGELQRGKGTRYGKLGRAAWIVKRKAGEQ